MAVTIHGARLGSGRGTTEVTLSGMPVPDADLSEVRSDRIVFLVPAGGRSGLLQVRTRAGLSNAVPFAVSATSAAPVEEDDVVEAPEGGRVVVNQILIMTESDGAEAIAEEVARVVGGEVVGRIPSISAFQIQVATHSLDELDELIERARRVPGVIEAGRHTVLESEAGGHDVSGLAEADRWPFDRVRIEAAWDLLELRLQVGELDLLLSGVGAIEDGVCFHHKEFAGYAGGGTVGGNALRAPNDCADQHGSGVASILLAADGNGDVTGLLSGVEPAHFNLMLPAARGVYTVFSFVARLDQLLELGVRALNLSFGSTRSSQRQADGSPLTDNAHPVGAIAYRIDRFLYERFFNRAARDVPTATFVASAGNGNTNAAGHYPGGMGLPNLITVAAIDHADDRCWFSNYGEAVDIAAPGDEILVADGLNAPNDYYEGSGTSFAAPFVTAAVALVQAVDPSITAPEIRALLRRTADFVDADTVWVSEEVGGETSPVSFVRPLSGTERRGRADADGAAVLNIAAALDELLDRGTPAPTEPPVHVSVDAGEEQWIDVRVRIPEEIFGLMDVVFLVDVSGSFDDDIATFQRRAEEIVAVLAEQAGNVALGIASFSDFDTAGYGEPGDHAFEVRQTITTDVSKVYRALDELDDPLQVGGDDRESQWEALFQCASASGRDIDGDGAYDGPGEFPPLAIGWRSGSLRLIVLSTDAGFHDAASEPEYPGASSDEALAALRAIGAIVVGLDSGSAGDELRLATEETGGTVHSLSADSREVVDAILEATAAISEEIDVRLTPVADVYEFVDDIEPEVHHNVEPGDEVAFSVRLVGRLARGAELQTIRFNLEVRARGVAVVLRIPVYIEIPPE